MSDLTERYRKATNGFSARVEATPPDRWSAASPCDDWTARDVLAHVVNVHRQSLALLDGTEPAPLADDADLPAAWREAVATATTALTDPSTADRPVHGPLGEMPFAQFMGNVAVADVLTHTWDLARAVGGDERLDPELVTYVHDMLRPLDEAMRRPGVFDAKIEPPAGADPQTELLCFLGRRV